MCKCRRLVAFRGLRSAPNRESGFSLIEILVALGILAAVAVVFLVGMATSSKAVMVSQKAVAVDSLAKSQLEDTKAQTYVDGVTTYPTIAVPADLASQHYAITVAAAPPPGHTTTDGIQQITITITRPGQPDFTLVGYKVNRIQ
jgi:prepilin-type N-terminal cleavage/methylation domain-containing protein